MSLYPHTVLKGQKLDINRWWLVVNSWRPAMNHRRGTRLAGLRRPRRRSLGGSTQRKEKRSHCSRATL